MNAAQFNRLAELFEAARMLDATGRAAFLASSCSDCDELRTELVALLQHHDATGASGLDRALRVAPSVVPELTGHAIDNLPPPPTIGQYDIEGTIGEGGMGIVYRARQRHPRRTVALKVIRNGRFSGEMVRRFNLEAAVLARLNHPGIAHIHEAGVFHDGQQTRPFFAMELVDGLPLTAYLKAHPVDLRQKLALFIQICHAVNHAHQKGVIHRDLKPGNVLVTSEGWPKILDFGVARATDSDLQVSIRTDAGQLVGTLPYMSPEQVAGRGNDLDTRSDLYALGVILYELLADRLPYDLTNCSIVSSARIIAENDPLPLSTVNRVYRGDLNTIVSKALEKDPERRYPSAAELAADVQRYLQHEPISARPATALYQLRKFARRNRILVTAAAIVCVVLVGASVWTTRAMVRTNRATSRALAINQFMDQILASADPATGRADVKLVEVLRSAAIAAATRFEDHPEVESDVHDLLGRSFQNLSLYKDAIVHLRRAHELRRETLGPADPATLSAAYYRAWVHYRMRQLDEALQVAQETLAHVPLANMHSQSALDLRRVIAKVRLVRGDLDEVEPEIRSMVAAARAAYGEEHGATVSAKLALIEFLHAQIHRGPKADRETAQEERYTLLREVSGPLVRLNGPSGLETFHVMVSLSESLRDAGSLDEAAALAQRVLELAPQRFGADHDVCGRAEGVLGCIRFDQRRFQEAADHAQRRIEGIEGRAGQQTGESLAVISDFLPLFDAADRLETGEGYCRRLFEWSAADGHDATLPLQYQACLARFLSRQGRLDEADVQFAALVDAEATFADKALSNRLDLSYGGHLAALGRFEEAEQRLLAVQNRLSVESWLRVLVEQELSRLYQAWGKPEQAAVHRDFVEAPLKTAYAPTP